MVYRGHLQDEVVANEDAEIQRLEGAQMLEETGTGPNRIGDVVRGMLEIGTPVPVLVQERPLPLVQIDCVLPEGGGGLLVERYATRDGRSRLG